jgi:hypothetical protein
MPSATRDTFTPVLPSLAYFMVEMITTFSVSRFPFPVFRLSFFVCRFSSNPQSAIGHRLLANPPVAGTENGS